MRCTLANYKYEIFIESKPEIIYMSVESRKKKTDVANMNSHTKVYFL